MLSYTGYVTIHYEKMKDDIDNLAAQHEDSHAVQTIVKNIGPIAAGFGLGMHFG